MRLLLNALLIALLAVNLSACGNKGSLKTPSQIAAEEAKKARKAQEKLKKEQVAPTQEAQ